MAEQKLDLLKLPAAFVAQTGACAAKVVWSNILEATFRASGFHHAPDDLRTESAVPNAVDRIDAPKYRSHSDASSVTQLSTAKATCQRQSLDGGPLVTFVTCVSTFRSTRDRQARLMSRYRIMASKAAHGNSALLRVNEGDNSSFCQNAGILAA